MNNKRASLLVPLPWTYASMNLMMGAAMALLSWSVNAPPWPRLRSKVGSLARTERSRVFLK